MSEKARFAERAASPNINFSQLCREFGISRRTGYLWRKRYSELGKRGLEERSHAPHRIAHKTPERVEQLIVALRDSKPTWGGGKLRQYLNSRGHRDLPSTKTIARILKRYGRICPDESRKHKAWIRFEHEHPNDLWQMDFKGHFALENKQRCHPLTLLDDHSRYSLAITACVNQQKDTVKPALIEVFRTYGLPKRMTMDNGTPWGCSCDQLHTRLTVWLINLGITVSHSRPHHPQTQGKLERFHRTFKEDLLSRYTFADMDIAQAAFNHWRDEYNYERPHGALELDVPAVHYQPSQRPYPEILPKVEYDESMIVRPVHAHGEILFNGNHYIIGNGFRGQCVGLKPNEKEDGIMDVYFAHQRVLKLDLNHVANL